MIDHTEYQKRRDELTKRCVNDPTYEKIANEAIDDLVLAVIGDDVEVYYMTCPLGFKCDGFTCKYNHSEYDRIENIWRGERRTIVKGTE